MIIILHTNNIPNLILWCVIAITIKYVGTDTIIIEITGINSNINIICTILGIFVMLLIVLIEILLISIKIINDHNNMFNIVFSYSVCTNKVLIKKDEDSSVIIILATFKINSLFFRFLINLIIILILIVNNIKHIFGPVTVMMIYI